MTKVLRAAGYCRTSGEAQRDNTSIPNQKQSIERYTSYQKWKFIKHYVDECKSGSKIAGRNDFQKMMRDAATGKFDILVVYDITRFGRDGFDILDSARTLSRDFNVHVVATAGGYDSRSNNNILANFAAAGMSEFERVRIVERLNSGKIAVARQGIPSNGRVPWGRTFDRETGKWGLDKDKHKTIQRIAKRYLKGDPLPHLAEEFGIPYVTLHKVLMTRCGTEWTINYKNVAEGTDSPITFTVPALLPESTIKAIRTRAEANRQRPKRKMTTASRRAIIKTTLDDFDGMSWQDSRELVEMVFDPMKAQGMFNGKRPGVYVSPVEGQEAYKSKQWRFEVYGVAFDGNTSVTDYTSF